jgi:uridine kinase
MIGTGERGAVSVGDVERVVAAVREAPAREARARAGRTRVVAIDGRSGSGKSTLADQVVAATGAALVRLEYLYGGWDGLEHGIDLLVSAVLEPLARNQTAYVPRYDWEHEQWGEPTPLRPPELLVVEGVGAGARRAARYESVLVWVELPTVVRRERALARDGEAYGPHWERWARQEDDMLAREGTPARADVVIPCSRDGAAGG